MFFIDHFWEPRCGWGTLQFAPLAVQPEQVAPAPGLPKLVQLESLWGVGLVSWKGRWQRNRYARRHDSRWGGRRMNVAYSVATQAGRRRNGHIREWRGLPRQVQEQVAREGSLPRCALRADNLCGPAQGKDPCRRQPRVKPQLRRTSLPVGGHDVVEESSEGDKMGWNAFMVQIGTNICRCFAQGCVG